MQFFTECLGANSVEDISFLVFQTLDDLGWDAGLFINSGMRTLDIDPKKIIQAREKTLIKNMQVGEVSTQKNNQNMIFHYMNISGKIRLKDPKNTTPQQHAPILNLLQATDKIVNRMKNTQVFKDQRKALQESSNNIKKIAHDVDTSINEVNKRTQETLSNSFGQMQDLARIKGLTASQIASFKNLEQQALNELTADNSLRLTVKKQFLLILELREMPSTRL